MLPEPLPRANMSKRRLAESACQEGFPRRDDLQRSDGLGLSSWPSTFVPVNAPDVRHTSSGTAKPRLRTVDGNIRQTRRDRKRSSRLRKTRRGRLGDKRLLRCPCSTQTKKPQCSNATLTILTEGGRVKQFLRPRLVAYRWQRVCLLRDDYTRLSVAALLPTIISIHPIRTNGTPPTARNARL